MEAEQHVVMPSLEKVVEANTLLSGLGFESGGLAAAHAIHNGLTALVTIHSYMHGEKVNFGTLTQLIMEGRPAHEVKEFVELSRLVGLAVTLADLGLQMLMRPHIHEKSLNFRIGVVGVGRSHPAATVNAQQVADCCRNTERGGTPSDVQSHKKPR